MNSLSDIDSLELTNGKQLYAYQANAIDEIFKRIEQHSSNYNLLYQLPTGGGKTVIFSEITKRYIQSNNKKVLILTHRVELCRQTSQMLSEFGVVNKVIDRTVKEIPLHNDTMCFVAMVETLNNRLRDKLLNLEDIGLIIVDEAHYNSFVKLFKFFETGVILGVTATPLSSNIDIRMRDHYNELIVGESITSLIDTGFLAKATTYHYQVGLSTLKVGRTGDYTVSSSELLYKTHAMQDKLLAAYAEKGLGKKTLIFNNGIATSQYVYVKFREAGYDIKHLDHTHSAKERQAILKWFREKPDAILTSVSILTTGFDEPGLECIILNRATKSLTLYFQMIGRGSRVFGNKTDFTVIDLGNNLKRFGLWDAHIDWHAIFKFPEIYLTSIISDEEIENSYRYAMSDELRVKFAKTLNINFDVKLAYDNAIACGQRPMSVIDKAIEHHFKMCVENCTVEDDELALAKLLEEDINNRVKVYTRCLNKTSDSYVKWLQEEYKRKLNSLIYAMARNQTVVDDDVIEATDEVESVVADSETSSE